MAHHCLDLLPIGGLIFVTVPLSYPYHRDPIDTAQFHKGLEQLSMLPDDPERQRKELQFWSALSDSRLSRRPGHPCGSVHFWHTGSARSHHHRNLGDAELPGGEYPGVARNQATVLA